MPSPQANQLTSRHRSELGQVANALVNAVTTRALAADFDNIDGWWDQQGATIATVATQGAQLTARLSDRYLRAHAATEGARLEPVRADVAPAKINTALEIAGPVAFKKNITTTADPIVARRVMAQQLRGTVTRLVLGGARDTTTATILNNDRATGWRRVASGGPCAFCAMLVSRGAAYKERTALRSPEFHDHDRCTYEPVYRTESEPAQVLQWRRQWEESTDGFSGTDALNAFRRHLKGQGLGTDV